MLLFEYFGTTNVTVALHHFRSEETLVPQILRTYVCSIVMHPFSYLFFVQKSLYMHTGTYTCSYTI